MPNESTKYPLSVCENRMSGKNLVPKIWGKTPKVGGAVEICLVAATSSIPIPYGKSDVANFYLIA